MVLTGVLVIIDALVPFEVQCSVIPLVLSEVLAPEALTVDLLECGWVITCELFDLMVLTGVLLIIDTLVPFEVQGSVIP